MRPDTRSFSFTWLRGQQQQQDHQNNDGDAAADQQTETDQEKSTPPPKTLDTSGGSKGKENLSGTGIAAKANLKLKRIGTSFARNLGTIGTGTKYAPIECGIPEKEEVDPTVGAASADDQNVSRSSSSGTGLSIGKRFNKTVQEMRTSLGNFSQKFRRSTRRRYRMGPSTPGTEISPTRRILGRTPTKLYSPFGFDSPLTKTPRRSLRPSTPRLARKEFAAGYAHSPSNTFHRDVSEARRGLEDFKLLTRDITRRSVRF